MARAHAYRARVDAGRKALSRIAHITATMAIQARLSDFPLVASDKCTARARARATNATSSQLLFDDDVHEQMLAMRRGDI